MNSARRGIFAWCLYDWANSAFPTVITTFVFAAYFTKSVAVDEVVGTSQWGYAMSISALAVALLGPLFGAVADYSGARKPWLLFFTILCVGATVMLWFTRADTADIVWALSFIILANFAFEMAMVFYNSMLPELVPPGGIGRLSGFGWGLGYVGGLVCLGVALFGFVQPQTPWFGLDKESAQHIRATAPLAAIWFAVFATPLFLFSADTPSTGVSIIEAARLGIKKLIGTFVKIHDYANIARFLLARMIYTDGLNTLFAFGGIYAAGTFGMQFEELIVFGIAMNLAAGLGALFFALLDDRLGPKRIIIISLLALLMLGSAVLLVGSKTMFWLFALPMGVFIGPAQAASRSMMANMAPENMRGEMFGLYALSGKATAFLGPALLAWITSVFASQRVGMATILIFFVIGLILLKPVSDSRA